MLLELSEDLLSHVLLQGPLSDQDDTKRVYTIDKAHLGSSPSVKGHDDLIKQADIELPREIE